jgi:nucleotide-binding universal stress UspA family protein
MARPLRYVCFFRPFRAYSRIVAARQKEVAMYSNVLVPLDGSPTSEAILPEIEKAVGPNATVVLCSVVDVPSSVANRVGPEFVGGAPAPGGVVKVPATKMVETRGQAIEHVEDEQVEYLTRAAAPLRRAGLNVQTKVALGPDAGEEILAEAERLRVDAILMATHGRTALGQIVFGSVAEMVMQSGRFPVLMVRPKKLN